MYVCIKQAMISSVPKSQDKFSKKFISNKMQQSDVCECLFVSSMKANYKMSSYIG